jgi:outer membrane lipoprotein-sorting protein
MKRWAHAGAISLWLILASSMSWLLANESAADIINKVDYNQAPKTVIYDTQMVIHQKDRVDTKQMKLYGVGEEKSYAVFLSPERDKGTGVLRLGDNLWMYLPSAEKTIKIAGHMLRQSFMGSDFSYSDSTERLKLLERYDAGITGTEQLDGRDVYVLELKAKQADANYFTRKMWVDRERYVILKQEMYAKSGKLLKSMTISDVRQIGDRFYVTRMRMEDKLKANTFTEMIMTNIKLDSDIPDSMFTMQNLERKN